MRAATARLLETCHSPLTLVNSYSSPVATPSTVKIVLLSLRYCILSE